MSLVDLVPELEDVQDWYAAAKVFERHQDADVRIKSLVDAFMYHFPVEGGTEAPFGPMMEFSGRRYPKPILAVSDDELRIWVEAFEDIRLPIVRARLGDLLWIRRYGQAHRFAAAALIAYYDFATEIDSEDGPLRPLAQAALGDSLVRAMALAVEINHPRAEEIHKSAILFVERELQLEHPRLVIELLERLARSPKKHRGNLGSVFDVALELYADDPFVLEILVQLRLSITPDEDARKVLQEAAVIAWIDAASRDDGLRALAHITRAHELALSYGLTDLLARVRGLMPAASAAADAGMSVLSTEIQVPTEKIDRFVDWFFSGSSGQWLNHYGAYLPVTRDRGAAEAEARDIMRKHPIQFLATRMILNDEGRLVRTIRGQDEHLEHQIAFGDTLGLQFWANVGSRILDRAAFDGLPSEESVAQFFATPFIPDPLPHRIAAAFGHYWAGRFDEALCIVVPRIEAIVREMARLSGVSTFNEATSQEPGAYRTLGILLADLKPFLPRDIHYYVTFILTNQLGANLRNRLCHGLLLEGSKGDAVLALHVATVLASLRETESGGTGDAADV
jgi:hypothetical protein